MRTMTLAVLAAGVLAASAWAQPDPGDVVRETTLADQTDVSITVYNNDLALVRDQRKIPLGAGEQSLRFADVAEKIQPETVSLRSLNTPGKLHILEQNYEYDLMSPNKLLEKYVGREVRLVNKSTQDAWGEVKAKLLSVNEGPVYQVGDEIYLGHPGQVVLPELPQELIAKPSLIWKLDNEGGDQQIEATYLTSGLGWKADYVINLNKEENRLDLAGWVTLNNQCGATFQNAQLKLVAGEVHQAPRPMPMAKMARDMAVGGAMAAPMPEMREEAFSEYHLYTLQRRTTIKQNESKQVSLLNAGNIETKKIYEFRGEPQYFLTQIGPLPEEATKIAVVLSFWNKEKNQLGIPLPAGVMRVYKQDSEGMYQLAGEDRVKHTPKDEEVRLRIGNAFDVVGERVQKDFKVIAQNLHQSEFEITIRNHKNEDIVVDVLEPMPGDWEVLNASPKLEKKDARTAICHLAVPANGEAKLTYRIQVKM